MSITGKLWKQSLAFWMTVIMLLALSSVRPASVSSQNTGSLEAECVVVVSASSSIVPTSLTPQEFCKVMVALFGNEWDKAAKLEATMIVVNDHDVRLAAAEAAIAVLQAQNTTTLQPQIDAINVKLANMAAALQ